MFLQYLWMDPTYYVSWVVIVCFSISVHECSHTIAAYKLGDATAYNEGYLTLNPIKVMGPYALGALAVLGLAWASVPVAKSRLHRRSATALISFSGPASNLCLGIAFAFLAALTGAVAGAHSGVAQMFFKVLQVGAEANAFLCLLNILPVPFLDGWDVFTYFVPEANKLDQQTQGYITLGVILGLFFLGGFRILFSVAGAFRDSVISFFLVFFAGG